MQGVKSVHPDYANGNSISISETQTPLDAVGHGTHVAGIIAARAKVMAQIATYIGLSRDQLYRSFSENGSLRLTILH